MNRPRDATWTPRLRPGVMLAPAGSGRWQARWDFDEVTFLSGSACDLVLPWLLPLLDGGSTVAELQAAAAGQCQPADVLNVLRCLDEQHMLTETESVESASALSAAGEPLGTIRVAVCGRSLLAERIVRAVSDHGMLASLSDLREVCDGAKSEGSPPSSTIPVVVETDWGPDELERFNVFAVSRRWPWMLVAAWQRRVLVGPLFLPGETGCHACYRQRLASHREYLAAYESLDRWQRTRPAPPDPQPLLPGIADLAAAWTALELLAHFTGIQPCRVVGRTLVYQPDEARLSLETVLRVPWCQICGTAATNHE